MHHYPPSIRRVIKNLSKLPGIGEKTAERLTIHMLRMQSNAVEALGKSILDLKQQVRLCSRCYALSDNELCTICSDTGRDDTLLCVVEQPADMASLEKSGAFKGYYHILSGVLSPMEGIGPENIRIGELISRVKSGTIKEVVLATGTNLEGETTAQYISELLKPYSVKITRIASGVPMGGDLKYVDQVTLKRAMETRHDF